MCVHYEVQKKVLDSPGTGIMDSWEPSCWYWELNSGLLGPLQEQQVSLTTESSLNPGSYNILAISFGHSLLSLWNLLSECYKYHYNILMLS